jgi:hypothetical protein
MSITSGAPHSAAIGALSRAITAKLRELSKPPTLGGNWYYGRFRVSANLILAGTERNVFDENIGHSLAARYVDYPGTEPLAKGEIRLTVRNAAETTCYR